MKNSFQQCFIPIIGVSLVKRKVNLSVQLHAPLFIKRMCMCGNDPCLWCHKGSFIWFLSRVTVPARCWLRSGFAPFQQNVDLCRKLETELNVLFTGDLQKVLFNYSIYNHPLGKTQIWKWEESRSLKYYPITDCYCLKLLQTAQYLCR